MDQGYEVLAIEKDPEAARVAASLGVSVVCADVEDPETLDSLRGAFDRVIFMDVLEHLVDPSAVLRNVRGILETDGRIVVTGPNVAYWAVRKDLLLGRWTYVDAGILDRTHLHFYTISGWRSLIEVAGYTVIAAEAAEGMLPLQHLLLKVPGLRRAILRFCDVVVRTWPSLFAISVLIEAAPKNVNPLRRS
jgi:2-polyprenyl-3-methyl-5-hydroxy-6-metoxy-1,4-benzoquinol methylase